MSEAVEIRDEAPGDAGDVRRVVAAAFGKDAEARLVDRLRVEADPVISLVAVLGGAVVGHVMMSPVRVGDAPVADPPALGLAPVAVDPSHQGVGIGGRLVREALERGRRLGAPFAVVLGHATYYPRFGFERASGHGLGCDFPSPDESFMAQELTPGALRDVKGTVHYHPAFSDGG